MPSFGACTLPSGRSKPLTIVGMPRSASAGTIGSVPPERSSSGRRPSTRSKASCASFTAGASGATRPAGADDQRSISTWAPERRGVAHEPLHRERDLLHVLHRRQADGDVRLGLDRDDRLLEQRRSAGETVDVHRGARQRPLVELLGGAAVARRRALLVERGLSRDRRGPARPFLIGRRDDPAAQLVRLGHDGRERLHERVHRVQRGAAEDARVEVAVAGAHLDVEVDEPARPDVEGRDVRPPASRRRR